MKTRHLFILSFAVFFLLATGCYKKRRAIIKINPEFARYVSGYTSGSISRRQAIRIELADQFGNPGGVDTMMNLFDRPDSSILKDVFEFSPEIKGRAVWVNRRVIEFIPSEPLASNQLYDVNFKLKRVAKVKKGFEEFNFQFSSYPQTMHVMVDGLKSYNAYASEIMKLTGYIQTGDFADSTLVRKTLKVEMDGKPLKINWEMTTGGTQFYFHVDSIRKGAERKKILVHWDGRPINSFETGFNKVDLPSYGDFTVEEVNIVDEDDQSVELLFSDPIQLRQNLDGIIRLSGVDKFSYRIENNMVKLFFDNRISGIKDLHISTGIKNFNGRNMNDPYAVTLEFLKAKPKVKLFGNGSVLPNSQGLIFPFEAISLKKVDVKVVRISETNVFQFLQVNNLDGRDELSRVSKKVTETTINLDYDKTKDLNKWNSHVIDLSKIMKPEPGAIYRVSLKFKKEYALCDCEEEQGEAAATESQSEDNLVGNDYVDWNERGWNSWGYDEGYDSWYGFNSSESACDPYYYYGKGVSRNILASDIGMIYKLDENKLSHAFISNMVSSAPIENCLVEYYDYTKHLIAKGMTDQFGMLDLQLKSKPFLMIASKDGQKGYLKLLDANSNSLSKFEVDGETIQKGIKGFFYGERGVWRPGDSMYLNFILEDKLNVLPENYPVRFELRDPSGSIVSQYTDNRPLNGFYSFGCQTSAEGLTGNYEAVAKVGNKYFYKSLMVETVKPNRLKIGFELPGDRISASTGDTIGKISVKWLHGAIAPNLNTNVQVNFSNIGTSFNGYKGYVFDSPLRENPTSEISVFNGQLDGSGIAYLKRNFSNMQHSAGMLKANFVTKVYEPGGEFSTDRYQVNYSPYKQYLGMKFSGDQGNWLNTNESYPLNLVALTEDGKKSKIGKVELKIYKLEWRWWYEQDDENLSDFVSRSSALVFYDSLIEVNEKGGQVRLWFSNYEYGRYLVVASDLNGGHQTGMVVNVNWNDWNRGVSHNNENAKMLSFSMDKSKYNIGEKMKLTIPSFEGGRALISIENSKKVISKIWINTQKGETRYEMPVSAEMTPNAYVHVTLLQPHASTVNDLPIRMYGVLPVMVEDKKTHLEPILVCSNSWLPESTSKVQVKESKGRDMTYTLAMVDDGLLDLTRFKTPQPWNTFYAKEALGVMTWDVYDQVIGAYSGKLDKLLSIGGDGESMNPEGAKANRFKPVVKYIGPFHLAAGKTATHHIDIPAYVGSVRLMVVAGDNKGAYGNTEKTVEVKKPLMVLATLPRVLGPGETVQLPVDVFAMEDRIRNVKVSIVTNDMLVASGEKTKNIVFTKNGDEVVNFTLDVPQRTGIASVKVIAECGSERSEQVIELQVRAPNPKVHVTKEYTLESGKTLTADYIKKGLPGTNNLKVEVSRIPSLGLDNRLDYLIMYPHGCVEQTTSSVFPQLFVQKLLDLDNTRKDEVTANIKAGIKRLQRFQTGSGGFSYWPGESYVSEWGTNYAGHFLVEAEKNGYNVSKTMLQRMLTYQSNKAKAWDINSEGFSSEYRNDSRQLTQAYRLYILALAGKPELGAMNRLREEKDLSIAAAWRLSAAYQLIGQHEVAVKLTNSLSTSVNTYRELSYGYGSDFRDKCMILESLSLLGDNQKSQPLATWIVQRFSEDAWMSTQEAAYGLIAISTYYGGSGSPGELNFSTALDGQKEVVTKSSNKVKVLTYNDDKLGKKGRLVLKNQGKLKLYVRVVNEGIPLVGDTSTTNKNVNMSIRYLDLKGQSLDIGKLRQGTDFVAEVTLTNPKTYTLKEMALTQIFASGWEIRNDRLLGYEMESGLRYKDYKDDRVYTYYDLHPNQTLVIKVRLNATYLGKYYLPSLYTEAMYDKSIYAQSPGQWVEVVPLEYKLSVN